MRRESVEPPRWLGALQNPDPKTALKTVVLMIRLMPGDVVVLLTIATNLRRNDAGLPAALPLIAATLLIAALPLLFYVLLRHRAQRLMPEVRAWMNTHIWLLNIITCVVFITLIL